MLSVTNEKGTLLVKFDGIVVRNPTSASVSTGPDYSTTTTSITIEGYLRVQNGTISEMGFCYDSVGNPTVNSSKSIVTPAAVGSFEATITGLSRTTTYYIKAYAIVNGEEFYGDRFSIDTNNDIPTVILSSVITNEWQEGSANLTGYVDNDGGGIILSNGFKYGQTTDNVTWVSDPIIATASLVDPPNDFTQTVSGLLAGTTLFKSFANNGEEGLSSGSTIYIKPYDIRLDVIEYDSPYDAIKLGVSVQPFSSNESVLKVGVCYSLNEIPNVDDDSSVEVDAPAADEYPAEIDIEFFESGVYYFRPYLRDASGTVFYDGVDQIISKSMLEIELTVVSIGTDTWEVQSSLPIPGDSGVTAMTISFSNADPATIEGGEYQSSQINQATKPIISGTDLETVEIDGKTYTIVF
jgi:hypothetical protein